jgi:cell division transport system permease protein
MVIAICLITSLFLLQKTTQFTITILEEKISLLVYFRKEVPEEEILTIKRELVIIPAIREVEYVSEQEALEVFTQRHRENPIIMESLAMIGFNPLMAHLNIKTKTPDQYEKVADFLEKAPFAGLIDRINFLQVEPVIKNVQQISVGLTNLGVILSLIFVLIAILVTFNTTKLAILNLEKEIGIMRLVGASNWFIRGPLIIQGVISGVLATIISLAIFALLLFFLSPRIEIFLPGLNLFGFFAASFFQIVLTQLAIGVGLGIVSSAIAIRKYLAV